MNESNKIKEKINSLNNDLKEIKKSQSEIKELRNNIINKIKIFLSSGTIANVIFLIFFFRINSFLSTQIILLLTYFLPKTLINLAWSYYNETINISIDRINDDINDLKIELEKTDKGKNYNILDTNSEREIKYNKYLYKFKNNTQINNCNSINKNNNKIKRKRK